ncbi:aspartokinase 1, chloroplastic-like [Lolium rigidum]|uniref:aspartokinase 1, chloroplastic-like n=1 Tax=Lolium rigidum TaxID=89674 RepID=UPI001F5DE822|nr:aspartokinase 1, chloroplastic-like [Lolium rigidum]
MAAALRFAAVAREAPAACRLARERDSCPLRSAAGARPGAQCWARRGLVLRCQSGAAATSTLKKGEAPAPAVSDGGAPPAAAGFTVVMKFGGSSVASAERMREVADLILSFPEETPVIVLSAMGKTTNNLLLAGEKAVSCGAPKASELDELKAIKELHFRTIDELGLDISIVSGFLDELEQLLKGVAMMKELTPRTRDYLVSFGECMSTRIFAAYLNKLGKKARQYDAFDLGFITTDDFTNADILEATYPAVAKRLQGDWVDEPAIPIVTGFLGKGWKSCAVTTLGRGGSDLTATTIGKALGLREIQVWKDVDGVLTCDPNIYANAVPVPFLTFDEAAELAYFGGQVLHPQSMRPAREGGIPVRVKNSYNRHAPGTVITTTRDMRKSILTSIVLKSNITMLDIVSTRMLGQYGFLAKVFSIFEDLGISVDSVATSEVSISLTLDPSKLWSRELIQQELDNVVEELEKIAVVHLLQHRSIISLIGNVQRSSLILEKAFNVLRRNGVNVQMISQGASKVNISLVVHDSEAKQCVQALHSAFFENGFLSEVEEVDIAQKNGSPLLVNSNGAMHGN